MSVTAAASGSGTLSYQWYSNSTNSNTGGDSINGATSATYEPSTSAVGTTYYYVVITNTDNSMTGNKTATATSSAAKVTVNALTHATTPSISGEPADVTANQGESGVTLSVTATASGSGTLSYQWYSNSTNSNTGGDSINGATSATYEPSTSAVGTTYYYVVITNTDNNATGSKTATVTSSAAKVTVNALTHASTPSISTGLTDRTANTGDTVTLSVTATASGSGTLSYQWYSNSTNSNTGGDSINGATSATYEPSSSAVGTTYYYVVITNTNNNATGSKTATATSSAAKVTVNALTHASTPSISTGLTDRTANTGDTVTLSVTAAASGSGTLSYQWYSNTTNSNTGGTLINGATSATYAPPTSTAGTTYYYVVITNTDNNATGSKTATVTSSVSKVTVNATTYTPPTQPSTPDVSTPPQSNGVDVLVNGKKENAGTATTSTSNNRSVTTVAVDQKKLDSKLEAEGPKAVITIPLNTKTDITIGELNGQIISNMEQKQAVVEIKTEQATYMLPAQQIDIKTISSQLGESVALEDIKIQIEIAAPNEEQVKVIESSAAKGQFAIVAPSVDFTVRGVYKDNVIEVSKFNLYVERLIAIPDGVDADKITTGIVVDQDGTVRHVPTKVIIIDGKHYAKISSLTNSLYSVVWHPLEFSDVANHWAKKAVNNMGSRMVIEGTGNGVFSPNRDITRAEFTAIVVRGLGLKPEEAAAPYSDVQSTDWYSSAVQTAYAYDLISGFEDGTFRPSDKITREQAMVIIDRAMKLTGLKDKLPEQAAEQLLRSYADRAEVSVWAVSSLVDSVTAGIITGRSESVLAPKAYITRAEVAAIIERLLQKSELI
ncbi:S-layer homology domain-containing protein [Paenibacillus oenotherae]|uniref:S-layer homology domain-containing protein n=1 Tax=Paenibacillus oenotherae TaxID=1435645 RepID=A0ABS7D1V5_9BACL|nr:S-layer homology domain-containing protein [Paenibacillus oenotherae]